MENPELVILTAEIARATFVTPSEHSQLRKLDQVKTGNKLRDHMTDLELIFTMLGEAGLFCDGFAVNGVLVKSSNCQNHFAARPQTQSLPPRWTSSGCAGLASWVV